MSFKWCLLIEVTLNAKLEKMDSLQLWVIQVLGTKCKCVCAVTNTCRLLHTLRNNNNNNGTWQNFFGDIEALTGDAGVFTRVACTGKGSELHVCGVNSAGQILHTIRYGNGTWQNFFGEISVQVCGTGRFQDIACGVDGSDVHFCVIT